MLSPLGGGGGVVSAGGGGGGGGGGAAAAGGEAAEEKKEEKKEEEEEEEDDVSFPSLFPPLVLPDVLHTVHSPSLKQTAGRGWWGPLGRQMIWS